MCMRSCGSAGGLPADAEPQTRGLGLRASSMRSISKSLRGSHIPLSHSQLQGCNSLVAARHQLSCLAPLTAVFNCVC